MQMNINKAIKLFFIVTFLLPLFLDAQVNTVEFGKNRIQYKKLKWKFYHQSILILTYLKVVQN